ncbi:RNA polymerase sigma factor [Bacillus suaedaesalsae]|uniref:RNA polymerase sigma factor n=1 Tax=Bacillus suaedaesalsae TaxID=2810349 RepID=A0ABS2DK20_9BACI|nr:sigma-70 family RNA polymerase sigma factor [Bacillus suaedaesalsae]MBM6618850.1 sigma-70 family RNA polymerase sigma factor [Bacillus suaedaesalsae]
MSTDEQLVREVITGNAECFREIVSRYESKVFSVAFKVARNQKDAEDIAQDVFVKVYHSLHLFKGESSFSTWIYRVTMNKSLDWKRKQERSVSKDVGMVDDQLKDHYDTPEQQLLKQYDRDLIKQSIKQLPEKYQIVLELYYFEECSYKDISDRLDIAVKTVETRLYRAKGLVREHLMKGGIG